MMRSVISILLLVGGVGCASMTFPADRATITGEIVGVGEGVPFGGPRSVWVKEAPDSPCGIVFAIDARTRIRERHADGSLSGRVFSDLSVGRKVRAWTDAVAESCPGQARAQAIELLP